MKYSCEACDGHCELIVDTNLRPYKCPYGLEGANWEVVSE